MLTLPIAAKSGQATSYIDALFTATTSVCVTGLVVETTMTHWSLFGQVVILLLVQIGGLGVVTITTGMFYVLGRRITLGNRMLIQESLGLNTLTGLVPLVKKIILGTAIVEGAGQCFMQHSLYRNSELVMESGQQFLIPFPAFCNAGMDIVKEDSFRSYVTNPVINFTTMALIVLGGLGFIVWKDLWQSMKKLIKEKIPVKRIVQQLKFQTKIVLSISTFLILFGTVLIFLFDIIIQQRWKSVITR